MTETRGVEQSGEFERRATAGLDSPQGWSSRSRTCPKPAACGHTHSTSRQDREALAGIVRFPRQALHDRTRASAHPKDSDQSTLEIEILREWGCAVDAQTYVWRLRPLRKVARGLRSVGDL